MKIAFFEVQDFEKEFISKNLHANKLLFFSEPLTDENVHLAKDCEIVSVFIYSKINSAILKKLPKTKIIITRSTGYDHISIFDCKKKKISVCNIPSYGSYTVAEHTFALILALARKLHLSFKKSDNEDFTLEGLKGFELKGKTLGVLGTGRIGRNVIKIARGFEMNVLASDPHPDKTFEKENSFKYVSFNQLIQRSDILTIHIPLTKKNTHLFDKGVFSKMKKNSIIVNTSRGQIIDNGALLFALKRKIISGAALDVIEGENIIKEEKEILHQKANFEKLKLLMQDHLILKNPNVVFTPHIAFYTSEALESILTKTIDLIKCFSNKKIPSDCLVC